jgi:tripartite-type tricarboxylate transporter receptor subunit TctC
VQGYEASSIFGVGVPAGTRSENRRKEMNRELNAALVDPLIKARLAELSSIPTPMTQGEFRAALQRRRSGAT